MKKRISFLLAVILMLTATIFAIPASADSAVADTFDVNAESPTISTATDYIAFFNAVFNQKNSFSGKTVTMLQDIVLNDTSTADWYAQDGVVKLTGTNDGWAWFEGTFDGGNHTLKGAIVDGKFRSDVPIGLFPYAREATIKNLVVDGFYICSPNTEKEPTWGSGGIGGLVGHGKQNVTIDGVTMRNGIVTCVENGKGAIGTVVGHYDGQRAGQCLKITNCVVENTVEVVAGANSTVYLGGIIGTTHEVYLSHPTCIDLSASKFQPKGSMDEAVTLKPYGSFRFAGELGSANGAEWTIKNDSIEYSKGITMNTVAANPSDYTDSFNQAIIASGCYGSSYTTVASFTVTWVVDGKTTTETYTKGAVPEYKGSTDKPMTDTKLYVFKEWSPVLEKVTANVTYTAVYDEFDKVKVTWIVDGKETVEYYKAGDYPNYKGETIKEQDDKAVYTFKGWDKTIEEATVDVTYTAVYDIKAKYQITWVIDGVETKETYLAGITPSYKGKVTKAEDADYTYKFSGWDKEIVPADADATYTAVFEKTAKNPTTTEEPKEESGCGSSISAGLAILMTIGMAGAFVAKRKIG